MRSDNDILKSIDQTLMIIMVIQAFTVGGLIAAYVMIP